ncbi:hypothetical protein ABXV19_09865 [Pseudomonas alkylphenolica]|uniref:hypothetical protein n=1 Tax=Pseudomonas alkylphenolica TaxID=237609 RepID=UPI0033938E59
MEASPCITPQILAALARSSVLVICAIAGVLCIYLGWRLYKDVVLSHTEGEAKTNRFSIKIVSAGPGVFFAAFGMWLLVTLVNRPYQMSADNAPVPEPRLSSFAYSELTPMLRLAADDKADEETTHCFSLVFFDGQRIDKKSMTEALNLAVREIAKGNPTENINGFTINRNQAINILTKLKTASQPDAL